MSLQTEESAIDLVDHRVERRALFEEALDATSRHAFVVRAGDEDAKPLSIGCLCAPYCDPSDSSSSFGRSPPSG